MSYHIYTTDGIILKRMPFGEANILLHILTADLGLIMASARSARLSASKLRPGLQEYAYVSLSCIKGKNGWKVTNVVEKDSFFFDYPEYSHKVLAHVGGVLLQMITGESPHREIFETVRSGFEFLKSLDQEQAPNFEALMVLRILYELGYVNKDLESNGFLDTRTEWNEALLREVAGKNKGIVSTINKALKESHL